MTQIEKKIGTVKHSLELVRTVVPVLVLILQLVILNITFNDGRITRDGVEILSSQVSKTELVDDWERFGNEL